jgi:hypothetical protein
LSVLVKKNNQAKHDGWGETVAAIPQKAAMNGHTPKRSVAAGKMGVHDGREDPEPGSKKETHAKTQRKGGFRASDGGERKKRDRKDS